MTGLSLSIPDDFVDQVASRVLELLAEQERGKSKPRAVAERHRCGRIPRLRQTARPQLNVAGSAAVRQRRQSRRVQTRMAGRSHRRRMTQVKCTAKPDCLCQRCDDRRRRRATAELYREHRPRQLQGEPRISRADEEHIADAARRRNGDATRADLLASLDTVTAELAFIKERLGRIAPGDGHRGYFREIEHGLTGVRRVI